MAWFDLKENKKTESSKQLKYNKIVSQKANSFLEIVSKQLIEGIQYRFVTNNSFNAITVLEFIKNNYNISEVYIAVYRMNLKSVTYLKEFIESNKVSGIILLSNFFRENKKYERWCHELISFSNQSTKLTVKFAVNHAKVFAAKTECGKHIVFEGSGNLSDNARIEQYLFESNKETYQFHKQWIQSI